MKKSTELNEIQYINDWYRYKRMIIFRELKTVWNVSFWLVFGVATTRCNKCRYTTWHTVKKIFNVCLEKSIPYSLYAYPKFIRINCREKIRNETPIKEISDIFRGQHIRWIRRSLKKLYMFCWQEVLNISWNLWAANNLLKDSSRNALKERNDFQL